MRYPTIPCKHALRGVANKIRWIGLYEISGKSARCNAECKQGFEKHAITLIRIGAKGYGNVMFVEFLPFCAHRSAFSGPSHLKRKNSFAFEKKTKEKELVRVIAELHT